MPNFSCTFKDEWPPQQTNKQTKLLDSNKTSFIRDSVTLTDRGVLDVSHPDHIISTFNWWTFPWRL